MSAETPTSPNGPTTPGTPPTHEPVPPGTPFTDRLVAAAKDLGLPPKTEEVIRKADDFITDAVRSAGTFTDERRDKISEFLDKAEKAIDEKTDGKYADKVGKARAQAEKGVAKLAEQGRSADGPASTTYPLDPTGDASVGEDPSPGSPS